jgi:hypothetical protein
MSRRRRVALLGLVDASAVVAVILWPRGPRLSRAAFERVHEGMTREEVSATLGRPPGVYTRRPVRNMVGGVNDCRERWAADDAEIIVFFGPDGRAFDVRVFDPLPDDRNIRQHLYDLVHP